VGEQGGSSLNAESLFWSPQPLPTTTIRLDPDDIAKARRAGGGAACAINLLEDIIPRGAARRRDAPP